MTYSLSQQTRQSLSLPLALVIVLLVPLSRTGVDAADAKAERTVEQANASEFVPQQAFFAARIRVSSIISSEVFEWAPVEIAQAFAQQQFGIDPMTVDEVKLLVGAFTGENAGITVGLVVSLTEAFNPSLISDRILSREIDEGTDGYSTYELGNVHNPWKLRAISDRKLVVGQPEIFEKMVSAPEGDGRLASLLAANPQPDSDVHLALAADERASLLNQYALQIGKELPTEIRDIALVPQLLESAALTASFQDLEGGANLTVVCKDETSAGQLQGIIRRTFDFILETTLAGIDRRNRSQDLLALAELRYFERVGQKLFSRLSPRREGRRLVIKSGPVGTMASSLISIPLMEPVGELLEFVVRQMSARQHLRQIALAMHNFHSAYKRLPVRHHVGDDGQELLSWRVAILPFLGDRSLWDEFHLDEPWDSPHNIELVERMPKIFRNPRLRLKPGFTVYRVLRGDQVGFRKDEPTRFRDIIDGTAHTAMVLEMDESEAVAWTKPDDLEIDQENPMAQVGHAHPSGFHTIFFDGSVRFLSRDMDPSDFLPLLTRSGMEVVEVPNDGLRPPTQDEVEAIDVLQPSEFLAVPE